MAKAPEKAPVAAKQTKHTSISAYVNQAFENRQWYARTADCLKAGTVKFYTGHLDLDLNLMGGFPYGKLSMVSGADSTGKTTLLLRVVARMLRTCRQCFTPILDFTNYETGEIRTECACGRKEPMNGVFVDAEDRFDPVWGAKHGLPVHKDDPLINHLIVVKPSTGEMVTDAVRKMMTDNVLDFVIVDSFATLFPESRDIQVQKEKPSMPGDSAKMLQGLLSTILHENLRHGMAVKRRCTVIGTQQLRAKIGNSYGPDTMIPGGWFLKHGLTTHIAMWAPKANEGIDKKKMADGSTHYLDFRGKIAKASLGGNEHNEVTWRVYAKPYATYSAGDSDEPKRVLEGLNLLKMAGKTKAGGYTLLGLPFKTVADMMEAVRQNESFSLLTRFILMYNKLPDDSRAYLDIDRYNYDPFYELKQDGESADGEEKLIKFRLAPRVTARAPGQKRRHGKLDDPISNKELAGFNPPPPADDTPDTPAADG